MSYKVLEYGNKTKRRNYSRVLTNVELPNLIDIQTASFEWFKTEGLRSLFDEISPIRENGDDSRFELSFTDFFFKEPEFSIKEAKRRSVNYSQNLMVNVNLINHETGENIDQQIFLGDFPTMTPYGTFIYNGAERVIVTQIVRSAGVFFSRKKDKQTGHNQFGGQIIPSRGSWIEFETDSKDLLYAKVDREKKVPLTEFIKAIGFPGFGTIRSVFFVNNSDVPEVLSLTHSTKDSTAGVHDALLDLYSKMKPGESISSVETARNYLASRIFDKRRYDLAKVGRYKVDTKLDCLNRALGNRLYDNFVDENGEVLIPKGTEITQEVLEVLKENRHLLRKSITELSSKIIVSELLLEDIADDVFVEVLDVVHPNGNNIRIIGNEHDLVSKNSDYEHIISLSDIIATVSYYINLIQGLGVIDDIDHLSNRRLRTIGELLQEQFRIGLLNVERNIRDQMTIIPDGRNIDFSRIVNTNSLRSTLREFFGQSQLSQFMDQINPLAELTHKRRISALGKGGITRDRAGFEVRDVHPTHYGRICPVETPEGQNIGLINSISTYASADNFGFIKTPYLRVEQVDGHTIIRNDLEPVRMTADEEFDKVIAEANVHMAENDKGQIEIIDEKVTVHINGDFYIRNRAEIEYIDVSPKQIVAVSPACIPFLEHDDTTRALMGSNMQRQAVPVIKPEAPIVGTGIEEKTAHDSGVAVISETDGVVSYVDSKKIVIKDANDQEFTYDLSKFERSNASTCINQKPIVEVNQTVKKGEVIADGPSMDQGELALGRNVVIAFMTWNGYNFEDAVIMSEKLVQQDYYTSIHIEEYPIEIRDTKLGKEEITAELDGESQKSVRHLDEFGIVRVGAEVVEGDTLVGRITPKGQTDPTNEQRFLQTLFQENSKDVNITSLKVPHGGDGVVSRIDHFKRSEGAKLPANVLEVVRVYIVQKRKISQGDKMSGRHGNKGVISNIVPIEDMPYMEDGTPIDIMLNPQGVPSRMNIGQVLEIHLGLAAKRLGVKIATPVFDGVTKQDLIDIMEEASKKNAEDIERLGSDLDPNTIYANIDANGKTKLYDGRTGRPFDNKISVGVMYMIKLAHMVDDKLHARATGHYTLITQQPMGGKAQNGGQRFGEMEVWALESYGAAYTLQEMMTYKSDDMVGRNQVYSAIVSGKPLPKPGVPEAFRALVKELQGLGLSVKLVDETGRNVVNDSIVEELMSSNSMKKSL